jgi:hypothetical protein
MRPVSGLERSVELEGLASERQSEVFMIYSKRATPLLSQLHACFDAVQTLQSHEELTVLLRLEVISGPGNENIWPDSITFKAVTLPRNVLCFGHYKHVTMTHLEAGCRVALKEDLPHSRCRAKDENLTRSIS